MWWSTADIVRLGVWLTVGGYVVTAVGIGQNWRAGGASIKRLLDRLRSIERRDVTVETGVANVAATAYGATTVTGTAGGEWSLPGRVGRLEAQVRNLTGRVADLTGRAAGLTDKVERLEHENRNTPRGRRRVGRSAGGQQAGNGAPVQGVAPQRSSDCASGRGALLRRHRSDRVPGLGRPPLSGEGPGSKSGPSRCNAGQLP